MYIYSLSRTAHPIYTTSLLGYLVTFLNDCPWGKGRDAGLMRAPERTSSRSYWPPHAQAAAFSAGGAVTTAECSCFSRNASVGDAGLEDDLSAQLS